MQRWRVACALMTVYIIWGTTYLAIRYVVESIPPFIAASCRFLVVAAILSVIARLVFKQRLAKGEAGPIALSGILMMGLGNGLVMWAEQRVPSGVAALWIASSPIFIMLLNWLAFARQRPPLLALVGAIVGAVGIAFLPGADGQGQTGDVLALLGACLFWTIGALMQSAGRLQTPLLLLTAWQSLAAGAFQAVLALITGELQNWTLAQVSWPAVLALLYLTFFGSLVAFTVFTWLLRHAEPHVVSTYTLVNPLVAVLMGAWLAQETINANVMAAAACIVAGVALLLVGKRFSSLTSLREKLFSTNSSRAAPTDTAHSPPLSPPKA